MNWLFYIGGGFLWLDLWDKVLGERGSHWTIFISSLLSWIGICWKISEATL